MDFCRKCGTKVEVHSHHVIPKNIGGNNDGTIYFCKKHHDIIHFMIPQWIWKFVNRTKEAKQHIKEQTKEYCRIRIRPRY